MSVALPTYNRAAVLQRALDSVLGQTYEHLEVVVSDNASDDETAAVCERARSQDPRVRYVRQDVNRGATENFNAALTRCRGSYVMMLADDDWLEPSYVEHCLKALCDDPHRALAYGRARYFDDSGLVHEGLPIRLEDASATMRVAQYFATVLDNASFYGLMPRAVLERMPPMRNSLGNDWLFVAATAFAGNVVRVDSTTISRSLGGASESSVKVASAIGLSRWQGRNPYLSIAWSAVRDIMWSAPIYRSLSRLRRAGLAALCGLILLRRHLWHRIGPIGEQPRGRHLPPAVRWLWQLALRAPSAKQSAYPAYPIPQEVDGSPTGRSASAPDRAS